ncbi:2Fe-2S iron-sulfur cluster-binding protein [Chitinimonas sp. BJYL2]|uniref:2Fe-2S iron-sulfur cluster-binding protein n=1 Tax=Chitinimonas sp. BJYL2 TaxID=2976696 RepID=UPI0022B489B6|nr:2Fe-2S iron-sulfur cluster-binding protein [Chitinimonas sp. BJYL2]
MTRLILQGGTMQDAVEAQAPAGGLLIDTVRELVRDRGLPLYWRCGQGTCGACLVYLRHAAQPVEFVPSGKERNVLARIGKLDVVQQRATSLTDAPDTPRLACHVLIPPGELRVRW